MNDPDTSQSLSEVTPLLSARLLRLLAFAAATGVWFSLVTAPAWQFKADDDLRPPIERPALAGAIPSTASMDSMLGMKLVRDQEGLPRRREFDSVLPFAWDIRHQVIDGAWAGHWASTDGKSEALVQLVTTRLDYRKNGNRVTRFVEDCAPSGTESSPTLMKRSGYQARSAAAASYCSLSRSGQTQIFIAVATADRKDIARLPDGIADVRASVERALPAPPPYLTTHVSTPYATAQTRRTWLSVVLLVPILWLLPTLLMDRAFWQRVRSSLSLRRSGSIPHPGWDIDDVVRARLWGSAFVACLQALVAIWVLRISWTWGPWRGLVSAVANSAGWNVAGSMNLALAVFFALAAGMLPALFQRRSRGETGAFVGNQRLLWVAGVALSIAVFGAAYFAMSLGVATGALGTGGGSDFEQERMSAFMRFASIPMVLLALTPMTLMRRIAMRALRTRATHDDRPPILLLRSFIDDGIKVRARGNQRRSLIDRLSLRRWERFEEVVASALSVQGPVLAVGQVGERLPPALGAVRRQFTNEEWQDGVHDLMTQASLICITLGRTESLAWEIKRIMGAGFLGKTVFVLPPTERVEHLKRLAVLAEILELNWVDIDVSPSGGWALAVRVEAKGAVPQVIRARAQEDVAYDVALEIMRLRIQGSSWPATSLAHEIQVEAPRAEIYPSGQAPISKSWWRRPWLLVTVINASGIVTLPFLFLAGEDSKTSAHLDLGTSTPWCIAADDSSGNMYVLIDGAGVYRVRVKGTDHPTLEANLVARIDPADILVADDGWLIAANHVEGTLQSVSPGTRSPAWKRDDLAGARGVVSEGGRVYVALPSHRKVLVIDRATGKDVAEAHVEGVPWSLAIRGDTVAVALADRSEVVRLELGSLKAASQLRSSAPATSVTAAHGNLWAYYPSEHALQAIAGPNAGQRIATRSERPTIASNGTVLAIGGVEMVTTVRPTGEVHRNRYYLRHPSEMAVTKSGDILASTDNELVFIRSSSE
jgi:hypothetical protein